MLDTDPHLCVCSVHRLCIISLNNLSIGTSPPVSCADMRRILSEEGACRRPLNFPVTVCKRPPRARKKRPKFVHGCSACVRAYPTYARGCSVFAMSTCALLELTLSINKAVRRVHVSSLSTLRHIHMREDTNFARAELVAILSHACKHERFK